MEEVETRFVEVTVAPVAMATAQALGPIAQRQMLGRTILLFDGVERSQLAPLGDQRTPALSDLFVALLGDGPKEAAA